MLRHRAVNLMLIDFIRGLRSTAKMAEEVLKYLRRFRLMMTTFSSALRRPLAERHRNECRVCLCVFILQKTFD
jgi:hypothetical protein